MRVAANVIVVAALYAAVAGCVSDAGTSTAEQPQGSGQLRYFGRPKIPDVVGSVDLFGRGMIWV
jgi:hypothetical protein